MFVAQLTAVMSRLLILCCLLLSACVSNRSTPAEYGPRRDVLRDAPAAVVALNRQLPNNVHYRLDLADGDRITKVRNLAIGVETTYYRRWNEPMGEYLPTSRLVRVQQVDPDGREAGIAVGALTAGALAFSTLVATENADLSPVAVAAMALGAAGGGLLGALVMGDRPVTLYEGPMERFLVESGAL